MHRNKMNHQDKFFNQEIPGFNQLLSIGRIPNILKITNYWKKLKMEDVN